MGFGNRHFTSDSTAYLPWTSGLSYSVGQIATYSKQAYMCITAHTSGLTIEDDILSGYWQILNKSQIERNYVVVGNNFEDNDASGWTVCKSSGMTNGFPTSVGTLKAAFSSTNGGTSATNLLAPSIESTNPLSDKHSLKMLTNSTGPTAGEMYISQPYKIDICDQAKPLSFKFFYQLSGDTNSKTDFSGTYSANTYGVAIYDLENNSWIQPAGCFNFVQKTGVGICSGTFQTPSNMTKFQIAVYVANTVSSTTTATLLLDEFYVGPQVVQYGAPVTDWVSYTPTVSSQSGTLTNYTTNFTYRRIGDSIQILGRLEFTGSVGTWSGPIFSLPSGLSIDNSKISTTDSDTPYGLATLLDAASGAYRGIVVNTGTLTSFLISRESVSGSNVVHNGVTQAAPFAWGTSDEIKFFCELPIQGWSSTVQMSNDTDTRVVAARVSRAGFNQTFAVNNIGIKVEFFSTSAAERGYDTHSAFNASNYRYIVPVSGYYKVAVNLAFQNTNVLNNRYFAYVSKNGSPNLRGPEFKPAAVTEFALAVNGSVYCNAGDFLEVFVYGVGNNSINTISLDGASDISYFIIERLSGPAVVQATDTVAWRGTTLSTQTIFSFVQITSGWSSTFDTHNAFNTTTGVYTIPVSGKYMITGQLMFSNSAANASIICAVSFNGSAPTAGPFGPRTITSSVHGITAYYNSIFQLTAGTQLTFWAYSTGSVQLGGSLSDSYCNIVRVGN